MNRFLTQLKQIWSRFSGLQRALVVGTGFLVVVGGLVAILVGRSEDWRPLGSDLSRKEVQQIVAKLEEGSIPYRLLSQGTAIEIPADRWDDVQKLVVREDLMNGRSGRGYDQVLSGGMLDTKSQAEYKRLVAQQDELAMAIGSLDGIAGATVYLTPAKNHWTKEGSERAKAAVMLETEPGHLVTSSQVESIVRFLAGSVKELDPENVVVTDTRGTMLVRPQGQDAAMNLATGLAQGQALRLQGAAEDALSRVFGRDRVVVRCHVELDTEMIRTETSGVVPESKVAVSEKIRSTENAQPRPGGTVSTSEVQVGTGGSAAGSKTEDLETQYEITRKKEVRVKDGGAVKYLTVSVLADESLRAHAQSIESVVKSAVGYMESRGDVFGGVGFAPFAEVVPLTAPEPPGLWTVPFIMEVATWVVTGMIGLGLVMFLGRSARRANREVRAALKTIAEEEKVVEPTPEPDPQDELKEKVREDVDAVTRVLKKWLYEPAGSRS